MLTKFAAVAFFVLSAFAANATTDVAEKSAAKNNNAPKPAFEAPAIAPDAAPAVVETQPAPAATKAVAKPAEAVNAETVATPASKQVVKKAEKKKPAAKKQSLWQRLKNGFTKTMQGAAAGIAALSLGLAAALNKFLPFNLAKIMADFLIIGLLLLAAALIIILIGAVTFLWPLFYVGWLVWIVGLVLIIVGIVQRLS